MGFKREMEFKYEKERELELLKHELKMQELKFDRETQLLVLKESWFLQNAPAIQQQYYPQQSMAQLQPQMQYYYPPQPVKENPMSETELTELEKSQKKYGGVKK